MGQKILCIFVRQFQNEEKMKKLSLILFAIALVFKAFSQEIITTRQICNHTIPFYRMVEVQNRHEYHSHLGITYIEELDSNGNLKSTSFWIGATPVYRMTLADDEGRMTNIFNKRVGRFDLCHVLNRIENDPNLRYRDDVRISLWRNYWRTNNIDYWRIGVGEWSSNYGMTAGGDVKILINPQNGREQKENIVAISASPTDAWFSLPRYEGGEEQMRIDLMNLMTIHPDSVQNMVVRVDFRISDNGVMSDFRINNPNVSDYLRNQIFDAMERLPNNWRRSRFSRAVRVPPPPPMVLDNEGVISNFRLSEPVVEVEQILHHKSISLILRRFTPTPL